jgi:hypothetical protein
LRRKPWTGDVECWLWGGKRGEIVGRWRREILMERVLGGKGFAGLSLLTQRGGKR